ncbi:hypothetical protein ACJZ2D_013747 [Fusarium nematophilum]
MLTCYTRLGSYNPFNGRHSNHTAPSLKQWSSLLCGSRSLVGILSLAPLGIEMGVFGVGRLGSVGSGGGLLDQAILKRGRIMDEAQEHGTVGAGPKSVSARVWHEAWIPGVDMRPGVFGQGCVRGIGDGGHGVGNGRALGTLGYEEGVEEDTSKAVSLEDKAALAETKLGYGTANLFASWEESWLRRATRTGPRPDGFLYMESSRGMIPSGKIQHLQLTTRTASTPSETSNSTQKKAQKLGGLQKFCRRYAPLATRLKEKKGLVLTYNAFRLAEAASQRFSRSSLNHGHGAEQRGASNGYAGRRQPQPGLAIGFPFWDDSRMHDGEKKVATDF